MSPSMTPTELRRRWMVREEVALLDVREEGPFSRAHPLFALSVPVSEVEVKLPDLVPRISTPIVVYDNGEGYTKRAIARIQAMGYDHVCSLDGGLDGYARIGEVYRDVNVPSKAFGELVEGIRQTPSMHALDVKRLLDAGNGSDNKVVVLDVRRFEEHRTMTIPSSQSCPGGELLYRVFEAAPDPDTTVIVHCAGRTRSIIGTQSLVNLGIRNNVMALRDGTIGWTLEGLDLETGSIKRVRQPSKEAVHKAMEHATAWAKHVGVPIITSEGLRKLASKTHTEQRTLYMLDVRDPDEYVKKHQPGLRSAPGGQLVQATDEWIGVRGARVVLYDTEGVRALMTATWLLQLGWEVYVLEAGALVPDNLPLPGQQPAWQPRSKSMGAISVAKLDALKDASIIDLARSTEYRRGHIAGAWFASGPELARDLKRLPGPGPIVLTSPDGRIAASSFEHIQALDVPFTRDVFYLDGGTAAWLAEGHSLHVECRWLSDPIDVYIRPYEGTENAREDMQAYIDWEHGLVAQLANDGVAGFHVVRSIQLK